MCRQRTVLQAVGYPDPSHPVRMHDEWRIAAQALVARAAWRRHAIRRLGAAEVRRIEAGPLAHGLVPPDEFLALAPWTPVGTRRGAVVEDAPIGRPREAPAMTVRPMRVAFVGAIAPLRRVDAGVDPATARRAAIARERMKARQLRSIGEAAAVDLLQHLLHVRLRMRAAGPEVPRQRAQSGIPRRGVVRGALLETPAEVIDEPRFAARIARWIDGLLMPLQQALRVGEAAFLFRLSRSGEEEHFGADGLRRQLTARDLRRIEPEGRRLGFDHAADAQPLQAGQRPTLQACVRAADRGVLSHHEQPLHRLCV